MNNKPLVIVAIVLGCVLLFSVGFNFFVDKVADRVIHKMSKEYCPSPYGPGIDPDRFDLNVFRQPKAQQPKSSLPQQKQKKNPWD